MNKRDLFTLVLGSTGKTGSRVVADLINRGLKIRTAARSGADVTFDWNQRDSYAPALDGIGRVYLVAIPSCASTSPMTCRHFSMQQKPRGSST
jgi:nucleoside-diphosphate-sugar epimerase